MFYITFGNRTKAHSSDCMCVHLFIFFQWNTSKTLQTYFGFYRAFCLRFQIKRFDKCVKSDMSMCFTQVIKVSAALNTKRLGICHTMIYLWEPVTISTLTCQIFSFFFFHHLKRVNSDIIVVLHTAYWFTKPCLDLLSLPLCLSQASRALRLHTQ